MEKVLAIGATTVKLQAVAPPTGDATGLARGDGALSCAVLVLEIPDYASRPVAEQLLCRQRLTGHVAVALEGIPADQRIVLDTGGGIAITFLERPLSALDVLRALLTNFARKESQDDMSVHGALNLGPIRVVAESNAHVNILGDGVSVAQRLLAFAKPAQILVAKTYVEAALALDTALAALFVYQGSRTDAHVRDHEVFELDAGALTAASNRSPIGTASNAGVFPVARSRRSRSFAFAFAGLSAITLTAMVVHVLEREIPAFHMGGTQARSPLQVATTPLRAVSRVEPVESRAIASPAAHIDTARPSAGSASGEDARPMSSPAVNASEQAPHPVEAAPASAANDAAGPSKNPANPRAPRATARPVAAHPIATRQMAERHKPAVAGATTAPAAPAPSGGTSAPESRASAPPTAWQPIESVSMASATAAAAPAKPAAGASALVTLAISPWGEVFVDGRSMGVSPPLREFELPVGKHTIVVRNGDSKAFEQELDLTSHQTVKVKHKFAQRS